MADRELNTRMCAGYACAGPSQLEPHESDALHEIVNDDARPAHAYDLLQRFRRLINRGSVRDLVQWLADAVEVDSGRSWVWRMAFRRTASCILGLSSSPRLAIRTRCLRLSTTAGDSRRDPAWRGPQTREWRRTAGVRTQSSNGPNRGRSLRASRRGPSGPQRKSVACRRCVEH
jgi:hypothetical protein